MRDVNVTMAQEFWVTLYNKVNALWTNNEQLYFYKLTVIKTVTKVLLIVSSCSLMLTNETLL